MGNCRVKLLIMDVTRTRMGIWFRFNPCMRPMMKWKIVQISIGKNVSWALPDELGRVHSELGLVKFTSLGWPDRVANRMNKQMRKCTVKLWSVDMSTCGHLVSFQPRYEIKNGPPYQKIKTKWKRIGISPVKNLSWAWPDELGLVHSDLRLAKFMSWAWLSWVANRMNQQMRNCHINLLNRRGYTNMYGRLVSA